MLKTVKNLLFIGLMLVSVTSQAVIAPTPKAPDVAAKSYILQDYDSGKVIAALNAGQRLPPASITKLMTAYVVSKELASGNISLED